MKYAAQSHAGKVRLENQDSFCVFSIGKALFAMVADGMGGHNGGSVASSMAVDILKEYITDHFTPHCDTQGIADLLKKSIEAANDRIYRDSLKTKALAGMGTTATIAVVRGSELVVANVGDSRAYLIEDAGIKQITVDQTLVQGLVDNGEITLQEASVHPQKHIITQAIGTDISIKPDIVSVEYDGQYILLCSDGLTLHMSDETIRQTIDGNRELDAAAGALIDMANQAGGEDNVTVVLIAVQ